MTADPKYDSQWHEDLGVLTSTISEGNCRLRFETKPSTGTVGASIDRRRAFDPSVWEELKTRMKGPSVAFETDLTEVIRDVIEGVKKQFSTNKLYFPSRQTKTEMTKFLKSLEEKKIGEDIQRHLEAIPKVTEDESVQSP